MLGLFGWPDSFLGMTTKGLLLFIPLLPKSVYTHSEVGWKQGARGPRSMYFYSWMKLVVFHRSKHLGSSQHGRTPHYTLGLSFGFPFNQKGASCKIVKNNIYIFIYIYIFTHPAHTHTSHVSYVTRHTGPTAGIEGLTRPKPSPAP